MRPFTTLRPRERRLTIVAGVLIGCWLLLSLLVQPQWDRVHELHLQVETHTEKLEALNRLFTKADAIEQEYQGVSGYLTAADAEQAHGAFLGELEALCRQSNLQLNLKPRPLVREERLSRYDVELDVEGSQADLLSFLDALLAMPRLIAIERLRLSSIPTKADALRASLLVQQLALKPAE